MNEILNLKHVNSLLKNETLTKQHREDAQELISFVIWKLEKEKS